VLFGIGLLVSGMSDPAKVLNFLDVLGNWDPSLAFVMGGAVAVTLVGYPLLGRRSRPQFAVSFQMPGRTEVDSSLLGGAALFGLGWGIGGFCPGPAWTSLSGLAPGALVFFVSMLAGMWLATAWRKRQLRKIT
jgi:uncharacterized membrane protein YedE/YeeE